MTGRKVTTPGIIAHELALISKELGIVPIMTVDGADGMKAAISLELLSATGTDRDKAQDTNLL